MRMRVIGVGFVAIAAAACTGPGGNGSLAPRFAVQSNACLPGERGYLRASLRGAMDTDLDWRGEGLECDGGARPDHGGLRVSFRGPADVQGRRLRIVLGMAVAPGTARTRRVPANITVIAEGRNALYATQGEDKCMVEEVVQQPLAPPLPAEPARSSHSYRVAARGYCIDPASTLDGSGHLYINRFDFAGLARFNEE